MRKGPWCWYLALGFTFLILLFYRVHQTLAQTPFPEWAKGFGPLPVRNQSPIQLLFFQFTPEGAKPLEKGKILLRLGLAGTNTLVSGRSSHFSGTMDMEMSYLGLNLQYGLMKGAQVGIELPFIYTHSGIMDSFIAEVEDFFGKQRGIRSREDRFEFDYSIMRNGKVFISGRRGWCRSRRPGPYIQKGSPEGGFVPSCPLCPPRRKGPNRGCGLCLWKR